jgi:phytoene desaturase
MILGREGMKKKIIVIGSGFGGLGAAIRLASEGHDVEIFEKRDKLGGRAYQYEINGFKFDGGPTVITAPYMFDELFQGAGKQREDYMKLVPLDPFYRIFDQDTSYFDYRHKTEDMLDQIKLRSPADAEGYTRFVDATKAIFQKFHTSTDQPFLHLMDMLKIMPDMFKLRGMSGTYGFVSRFIKDEFLRRTFSFHPLLIGGNPYNTPSIYTLIVQFEKEWGVHYALGGTGAIVAALGKLFNELGGVVNTNCEVKEIAIKNRKAVGIRLEDGQFVPADYVVSNADIAYTYRCLIPSEHRRYYPNWRIDAMKYSMSLFVYYFGTKRRYTDSKLHHHNIILNKNYKNLLSNIFNGTKLPEDFSLYLHMPTFTDPSTAPDGHEAFYVLSPVPVLGKDSPDWKEYAPVYKDKIIQFLEDHYLPDLRANLVAEHYIDPLHFQKTLNSFRGAAFSIRPSLLQSAWLRPHNRSEDFSNLYLVGAGTHPGAGVPAVLSSGKIAANLIAAEVAKESPRFPVQAVSEIEAAVPE